MYDRILADIGRIASDGTKSFHDRYLRIYKLIRERDEEIARAFNDYRRSTATFQLAAMVSLDLVTDDELLAFTPGTRSLVELLCKASGRGRRRSGG